MAFPQVAAVNGGNDGSGTNHTVNLPSGIDAGDLLLVFFASDAQEVITFPNEGIDWIQLFETSSGTAVTFGAWYRIADGGEGATIIVTTGTTEATAHTSYRITGYSGTPEAGTPVIETLPEAPLYPNPPSLSPSWGAQDTLWFAAEGNDRNRTVSSYPTNYTDGRNDYYDANGGCCVGTARRQLNAASENPLVFTLSSGEEWVANTIAIRPAAGGPTPGWNQLQYTSEPPTPNAWNQLKQETGSGDYKKLFFEGE